MLRRKRIWRPTWTICVPGVALLLAVSLPHLDQGDFRTDTAWYAAIALQAARTGSWWTLYAEPGEPYFNKPPLVFWLHAPLLWAAGPRLWAARLPTVVAAAGCVALTALIARLGLSRSASAAAGCVLALTLEFFRRTREISLDLWQALFLLMMVWLAARGALRGRLALVALAGVPLGLALMCKPLQGLLGAAVMLGWMLWAVRTPRRTTAVLAAAAAMVGAGLTIAAPWHLSMAALHGDDFATRYFGTEVAARVRGELTALAVRPQPWWFYLKQVGQTYWPWLGLVAACAWAALRRDFPTVSRACAVLVLGWAWTIAWLAALSIFPDRRDRYALVIWPGLALVSSGFVHARSAGAIRAVAAKAAWQAPVAAAVIGTVLAVLPVRISRPADPQWPALFAWMRNEGVRELHRGGIVGNASARLYLEFGRWPIPIDPPDRAGTSGRPPPRGALLIYHRRGGRGPGPGEPVVFRAGDLTVTRLESDRWQPVEAPDPGE